MANDTLKLTDQELLAYARTSLQDHLSPQAEGYQCSTIDLLDVLPGVAVSRDTIESVCTDWIDTVNTETIRGYLNEQLTLEGLPELDRRLNAALAAEIPVRISPQEQDIAIDLHGRPRYGKTPQEEGLWLRGKAKDGTTRFYRVATAYVMLNGLRVTLAICFFLPGDTVVTVVDALLRRVRILGVRTKRLFLDKGFAGIEVMEYLTQYKQPALIACPIRGKTGGTRALCRGNKSYRTTHTFRNATKSVATELAVCRAFTTANRTGRMKRRVTWLIFILIHLEVDGLTFCTVLCARRKKKIPLLPPSGQQSAIFTIDCSSARSSVAGFLPGRLHGSLDTLATR